MSTLIRVRDTDLGVEYSIDATYAREVGLKILDGKKAVDERGRALPPKTVLNNKTARQAEEGA